MGRKLSHIVVVFFLFCFFCFTSLQSCNHVFKSSRPRRRRYRKNANAFGVSSSSVSILIRKVAKIVVENLVPGLIKSPKTVTGVEALTENFLNAHVFLNVWVQSMEHMY